MNFDIPPLSSLGALIEQSSFVKPLYQVGNVKKELVQSAFATLVLNNGAAKKEPTIMAMIKMLFITFLTEIHLQV